MLPPSLETLRLAHPDAVALVAGLVGLCIGSFLNVCAHRLPRGESVISPGSRCACGQPIPAWLNLPLLGWLALGGKARCCGARISARYPLLELAGGLALALAWYALPADRALAASVLLPLLLLLAACDIDSMTVPDAPNFLLVLSGLAFSAALPSLHGIEPHRIPLADHVAGFGEGLLGVAVGTAVTWWVRTIGSVWKGREAMGEADILLVAGVGAFGGWQGALFCFFAGSVIGLLLILPRLVLARVRGTQAPEVVPFVPALALAGALWFFRGPALVDLWLGRA